MVVGKMAAGEKNEENKLYRRKKIKWERKRRKLHLKVKEGPKVALF